MTTVCGLATLAATMLAGCLDQDEGALARGDDLEEAWHPEGKADDDSCDLDALPASEFYSRFDYYEVPWPNGSVRYQVGSSWTSTATLDNGDRVKLVVYFLEGSRVIAEYSELRRIDGVQSELRNRTVLVTRRSIDAATKTLTIPGLGTGTPVMYYGSGGCAPAIKFQFTRDVRSWGLAGDEAMVVSAYTSAYVIDPDHLDEVPENARRWFQQDVANGTIAVQRF